MVARFRDRTEAGRLLADRLLNYANRADVLILALPRGGVPVAFEIAKALHAPLDVFIVRKLGVPGEEELAMGAIASGGIRVLYDRVIQMLGIPEHIIETVAVREQVELERRERLYRHGRPVPVVSGRTVILVDDGIATGTTLRAAIAALRQQQPSELVIAVPVAALPTYQELQREGENIVCVLTPPDFAALSQWYEDFHQTSDEVVCDLLQRAARERSAAPPQ